jgi:radical SAM protein with 4Fe4S-binding SPASM domain
MEAAIITTYRCNSKCQMCNTWKFPTEKREEFEPSLLDKLPRLSFCNVTGGEPFLRDDIEEIVRLLRKRARRLVISTNGFLTEKIVDLAKKNPKIGIRISIEGLPAVNDELRGVKNGFDHGLRTLVELLRIGIKDVGFGITVSDQNAKDLLALYHLAKYLNIEFATAVVHNSYYFHKSGNRIKKKEEVTKYFEALIREQLGTWRVKNWYRAYFNYGLINCVHDNPRLLPCAAGTDVFFLDPWGEIRPCNGMEEADWCESMGNLNSDTFENLWNSKKADQVRRKVKTCSKNCWMIGSAAPAMKRNIWKPTIWILKRKLHRDKKESA